MEGYVYKQLSLNPLCGYPKVIVYGNVARYFGKKREEDAGQDCSKQFGSGTAIQCSDNNHTHFCIFTSSISP